MNDHDWQEKATMPTSSRRRHKRPVVHANANSRFDCENSYLSLSSLTRRGEKFDSDGYSTAFQPEPNPKSSFSSDAAFSLISPDVAAVYEGGMRSCVLPSYRHDQNLSDNDFYYRPRAVCSMSGTGFEGGPDSPPREFPSSFMIEDTLKRSEWAPSTKIGQILTSSESQVMDFDDDDAVSVYVNEWTRPQTLLHVEEDHSSTNCGHDAGRCCSKEVSISDLDEMDSRTLFLEKLSPNDIFNRHPRIVERDKHDGGHLRPSYTSHVATLPPEPSFSGDSFVGPPDCYNSQGHPNETSKRQMDQHHRQHHRQGHHQPEFVDIQHKARKKGKSIIVDSMVPKHHGRRSDRVNFPSKSTCQVTKDGNKWHQFLEGFSSETPNCLGKGGNSKKVRTLRRDDSENSRKDGEDDAMTLDELRSVKGDGTMNCKVAEDTRYPHMNGCDQRLEEEDNTKGVLDHHGNQCDGLSPAKCPAVDTRPTSEVFTHCGSHEGETKMNDRRKLSSTEDPLGVPLCDELSIDGTIHKNEFDTLKENTVENDDINRTDKEIQTTLALKASEIEEKNLIEEENEGLSLKDTPRNAHSCKENVMFSDTIQQQAQTNSDPNQAGQRNSIVLHQVQELSPEFVRVRHKDSDCNQLEQRNPDCNQLEQCNPDCNQLEQRTHAFNQIEFVNSDFNQVQHRQLDFNLAEHRNPDFSQFEQNSNADFNQDELHNLNFSQIEHRCPGFRQTEPRSLNFNQVENHNSDFNQVEHRDPDFSRMEHRNSTVSPTVRESDFRQSEQSCVCATVKQPIVTSTSTLNSAQSPSDNILSRAKHNFSGTLQYDTNTNGPRNKTVSTIDPNVQEPVVDSSENLHVIIQSSHKESGIEYRQTATEVNDSNFNNSSTGSERLHTTINDVNHFGKSPFDISSPNKTSRVSVVSSMAYPANTAFLSVGNDNVLSFNFDESYNTVNADDGHNTRHASHSTDKRPASSDSTDKRPASSDSTDKLHDNQIATAATATASMIPTPRTDSKSTQTMFKMLHYSDMACSPILFPEDRAVLDCFSVNAKLMTSSEAVVSDRYLTHSVDKDDALTYNLRPRLRLDQKEP